jgi:hypothetical protein
MSIYGISNNAINRPAINRPATQVPVRDNTRTQGHAPAVVQQPVATPAKLAAPARQAQSAVPTEAPAGTDPALWSILSTEERSFFAKSGAMGPLTYGRAFTDMKSAQLPANRGGRLDVKI